MAWRFGDCFWPIKALVYGIVAITLSFLAYSRRIQEEDVVNTNGLCLYPSSQAFRLGITAAILLLIEQITISVATSCFCCCGVRCSSKCSSITAIILYIFSWFAFVIAFIGLIYTAVLNNSRYLANHHGLINKDGACFVGKDTLFLGAAYWAIISIVSGLISYAFWERSNNGNNNYQESADFANYRQGIAMGQPPHTQLPKEQC